MNFFWRRCFCCKGFKNTKVIDIPIWYDFYTYYYHDGCVREVLCYPEKYSTNQIIVAEDIFNEIKRLKEHREGKIKSALAMCDKFEST